ncbi:hypothetical protein EPA93_23180 [Ktedonosporobacter rubrisoli]|uniref:HEAT repeat domain-containing protein n=1 Tax=Ktedonosporobacter rubrisoli TaxID=2509675 RepID=A0A4P6JT37_KTERU|nr:HEAT repeat domain-containing protein [Ktedonosporobacter rubrisoli]QBD78727.1 hypothetical protein EPA93_23180 [Ktedonosporobacter rubrisoli]
MDASNFKGPQDRQSIFQAREQEYRAPESLQAQVLQRIEIAHDYLTAQRPEQEMLAGIDDARWEVRAAALHGLQDVASSEVILQALQDEHPLVRAIAVQALGQFGKPLSIVALTQALEDPAWEVRERAVFVVRTLEGLSAQSLLTKAARDPHPAVRLAAREALAGHKTATTAQSQKICTLQRVQPGLWQHLFGWPKRIRSFWIVCGMQLITMRGYWLTSLGVLLLGYMMILITALGPLRHTIYSISLALAMVTTFSATIAVAFTTDLRYDRGIEITLSTSTSLRTILCSRYLIAIGLHVLFSALASTIIALLYQQACWSIMQMWLGPLFLASSLTFTLVLILSAWISVLLTFLVGISQTLNLIPGKLSIGFSTHLWQTNPEILLIALACFALALFSIQVRARNKQTL